MSDDAAQQAHESTAQEAVGTTSKATGEPAGASERAAPKPKVSAEDLARALGVGAATAAVKAEAKESPNFGLKEGSRVEVRWVIADGEGEAVTETIVWWGATVKAMNADAKKVDSEGEDCKATPSTPSWELHYDENADMGFPAEIRPVVLLSDKMLEDPGEGSVLRWRVEGDVDEGEEDDASFEQLNEEPSDPNVVHVADIAGTADHNGNVSINGLLTAQQEVDDKRNGGRSLEQLGNEAFGTLPMDRQQKMATAFVGLKNGLSQAFQELQERNGPDYAITKDDIAEIMRGMHR